MGWLDVLELWFGLGSGIGFNLMIHFVVMALDSRNIHLFRTLFISSHWHSASNRLISIMSFLNFVKKPHKVLEFIKIHRPYPSSLDLRTFPHFTISRVHSYAHTLTTSPQLPRLDSPITLRCSEISPHTSPLLLRASVPSTAFRASKCKNTY